MYEMRTRSSNVNGEVVEMRLRTKKLLHRAMAETKGTDRDCSSIPKLALAAGRSIAMIGFLVSEGRSGRDKTSVATAQAIADALGWDVDELFEERVSTPSRSTSHDTSGQAA